MKSHFGCSVSLSLRCKRTLNNTVIEGYHVSMTRKRTVPKNEAQTTKLTEGTGHPNWLKTFFFVKHHFRRAFSAQKVKSFLLFWRSFVFAPILPFENSDLRKKKVFSPSGCIPVGGSWTRWWTEEDRFWLVWSSIPAFKFWALKKRTFGYFLGVMGGQFISNGKRGQILLKEAIWLPYGISTQGLKDTSQLR